MFAGQFVPCTMGAMDIFRDSAFARRSCLDGERAPVDFKPLYGMDGRVNLVDAPVCDFDVDEYSVCLVPNKYAFAALMYCFCGEVAHMKLPRGVFLSGSSVVASVTMPVRAHSRALEDAMTDWGRRIVETKVTARLVLARRFSMLQGRGVCSLVERIIEFVGCAAGLQEVRHALDKHSEEDLHAPLESDPLRWDWNGFGPYNRADIDVFVTAATIEQADEKVRAMHSLFCAAGDAVVIRTPNTITYCRSWPERHVQVVLLVGQHAAEHCLFCDFDCTSLVYVEGEVYTTARSRHALVHKVNLVPPVMLELRHDEPKRVAKYVKRGFRLMMLPDDRFDHARLTDLMGEVQKEWAFAGKKLLDLHLFAPWTWMSAYGGMLDVDAPWWTLIAATVLATNNTGYSEFNIPRMPGLTARGIQKFFLLDAAQRMQQLSCVVSKLADIPNCVWKLQHRPREVWAEWNFV